MKKNTVKMAVGNLKFSDDLLAMRPINSFIVSKYRQCMRNGDIFPPIIVDIDGEIICGNHRGKAYIEEFGPEHSIDVVVEEFKDEKEKVYRFARDNATHGNPLTGFSRRLIADRLIKLGSTADEIARLFGVSVKKVEEWGGMSVCIVGNPIGKIRHYTPEEVAKINPARTASAPVIETVPVKRGVPESAYGSKITAEQYAIHRNSDAGVAVWKLADQLTRYIHLGWVDVEDLKVRSSIIALKDALSELKV